ncbi:hypothetical protein SAMN05720759_102159 [Fibrobacter sp. UWB12]|nr:hypothetical protein SAMN05720759_102159 [Fibrobacter sp. UWB12]
MNVWINILGVVGIANYNMGGAFQDPGAMKKSDVMLR